jgi:hypothetical protein
LLHRQSDGSPRCASRYLTERDATTVQLEGAQHEERFAGRAREIVRDQSKEEAMTMCRTVAVLWVSLLAGLGCASEQRATSPAAAPGEAATEVERPPTAELCPMNVPDTEVQVEDYGGGVALLFTTETGDVEELRRKVQQFAELHNAHYQNPRMVHGGQWQGWERRDALEEGRAESKGGPMGWHRQATPGLAPEDSARLEQPVVGSVAKVVPTENGARLILEPTHPQHLEQLKQHVREHASRMQKERSCPLIMPRPARPATS